MGWAPRAPRGDRHVLTRPPARSLKIEEVLNSIALAFCGIQILLGIIALVTFQQATFTS